MSDVNIYKPYSAFLSAFFQGRKVQKLPVEAGFTCPVRDGKISRLGCSFCNGKSFIPSYCTSVDSISEQLEKGKSFFSRKYKSCDNVVYLAYFQSATNTYASIDELRKKYQAALSVARIGGLVLSTRPDCISPAVVSLLKEFSHRTFVMVELGCESFDDDVLCQVGRGHNFSQIITAIDLLKKASFPVSAHLIFGLPGEKPGYIERSADVLNSLSIDAVKLHQLQIVRGARYAKEFTLHPEHFNLYTVERYVADVCSFLERLSPEIAVDRLVSEMPSADLIAPKWGLKPDAVVMMVRRKLLNRHSFQGRYFK